MLAGWLNDLNIGDRVVLFVRERARAKELFELCEVTEKGRNHLELRSENKQRFESYIADNRGVRPMHSKCRVSISIHRYTPALKTELEQRERLMAEEIEIVKKLIEIQKEMQESFDRAKMEVMKR